MNADEIVSWKRIDEFPQYEVSNTGLVRRGAKVKKCRANSHGYPTAVLCESGKRKNIPVHRLVAIAFIPNPDNLPQVNHKDENKQNNNVANLEWCDAKYNNNYSNAAGRAFDYKSIPVVMLTFDGAVHGTFPGSASASRQTGISQGNINEVCMGKRASAGGYVFRYASDLIQELQAQLAESQRREKPLTLDELRGMGGEPIWIKEFPPYAFAGYKVLSLRVVDVYGDIVCEDGDIYDYERYGKTWLAYRAKPERSEG